MKAFLAVFLIAGCAWGQPAVQHCDGGKVDLVNICPPFDSPKPVHHRKRKPPITYIGDIGLSHLLCNGEPCSPDVAKLEVQSPPASKLNDSGTWGCPSPYWPFQSWTHKWSCVKGEFEAKSTWNLYKVEPFFIIEGTFEYRDAWFVHYEVGGDAYKCDRFKRDDGLVHSLIIGQEYTQTCDSGKLGLLVPLIERAK